MVLYGALQIIYLGSPEWLIKGWLVERITVTPSASLINFLWPDLSVQPSGSRLVSAKGSINVLRGC